ncbi:TolC family protein [Mucilaginibacter corticis]|uniref:TolC family protein n=1 Tax=Mucilaginibacter corticis TaxID=2597670 RepID=A0A556ML85_9SPHI|nr:TolC family protein [Mucilaginibacter corticis]TSJ40684.1 TolC family protein [Mucilaginibacter corticis]
MLLKPRFVIILLLFSVCTKLYAQDSTLVGKTIKWDLTQCIEYAKKNNIQINSLRLSKQLSQQELELAKAAKLPDLAGSATQNFAHYNNGNNTNGSSSGFSASGNYGLSSSVTLYNGNYLNNNISQKNLGIQAANLNILQQENDITLQITQAYLAILLDKENIIYDTDLVNTSAAQVKLEQQRYTVGSVARKDLIQLQAQQASDQYTLVNVRNQERGDLLTLKQLLILPSDLTFDIVRPDTIVTSQQNVSPLRDAQNLALNNRPEVKSSQLGVQIAQYDVVKAAAGYKPSLTAGGSIGSGYNTGAGNGYFGQFNNNLNEQIGLTLSVPIFTRRVVKTQVEEAKINVEQSKLDLQNTKVVLSASVERAFINVQNAQSQYDAAAEQYKFNQESYRIANEQLKVGVANTVDFLLQKNLFVQAQQAFVQAKYNVILSLRIYDFYRGVPIKL